MKQIFISYSHKDKDWKDQLVTQLKVLEHEGHFTLWDDQKIRTGDEWYPKLQNALNEASVAVMMITANFLTSDFIREEEIPRLLEQRANEDLHLFPVIVEPCAWESVEWLAPLQVTPTDGEPLMKGSEYDIKEKLTKIAYQIHQLMALKENYTTINDKIFLSKLPTMGAELFGREQELKMLDDAWADPKTHIVSLEAWGGAGKTSLVNHWLNRIQQESYRGAERVYGWSFYSRDINQGQQISADLFISHALAWFGDLDPARGAPWEKAIRLAGLIRKQRTLLDIMGNQ